MRNYIIIAAVVLSMSTLMAGNMGPPSPLKSGINTINWAPLTTSMPDGLRGDFLIVNGYRDYRGPNSVVDSYT